MDRLDDPGLGEWTVRDLVGHTSRSLITTEEYLTDDTTGIVDIPTAGAYYVATRDVDHAAVAERGRAAGAALGDDPLGFVTELVSRVPPLVEAAPDEARMRTPFGTMVLGGVRRQPHLRADGAHLRPPAGARPQRPAARGGALGAPPGRGA